jgi:hypothetical protein
MTSTEAYEILGLEPSASKDEIKAAFRRISHQVHPDKGGTNKLFQITHDAYELLCKSENDSKSDSSTNTSKTKTTPKREYTWSDIIRASDFILPFDSVYSCAVLGNTVYEMYRNTRVFITPNDLAYHHIRSELPITVTVKIWPSILDRILCKEPVTNQTILKCGNNSERSYKSSMEFGTNIKVDSVKGYHEITIEFLDQKETQRFYLSSKHCVQEKFIKHTIHGLDDINIKINTRLGLKPRRAK